jgi:hypothetical protein
MKMSIWYLLIFLYGISYSQKSKSHEVSLGVGVHFPVEESPLNVSGEEPLPSSFIGNGAYRVYLTELVAVGIRGSLTTTKLKEYLVQKNNSSTIEKVNFNLNTYNVGLESQIYLSSRGQVRPYLTFQILYCENSLTESNYGELKNQGYLAGGGIGVRVKISDRVFLSAEGFGLFGSAKWKLKPFGNSSGVVFNPSSYRALFNVLFLIK